MPMTPNTILVTWSLHDVNNQLPKFLGINLGSSLMFYKGFMLMTVTSFTELEVLSLRHVESMLLILYLGS